MEQYRVTGMSCAACSARVEKAVAKVPGVASCSVSLLTNSMGVEGSAAAEDIIRAVKAAGYQAALRDSKGKRKERAAALEAEDFLTGQAMLQLKKRLFSSVLFLLALMYFSMGHAMWNWPLPKGLEGNPAAVGLLQLLLAGIVMVINQQFFIHGFGSLFRFAPNMDTLVALGSLAAFAYSTYALFAVTDAQAKGDMGQAMLYLHEFYFESAATIVTLITVGKMLEAHSKGRTTDALKNLIRLAPKKATVLRNGEETEVPAEQVKKGDIFIVRPGEHIPVDGVVLEGNSAVNESSLTGESIPADKFPGDEVSAATINSFGFLKCRAVRVGEDTALSQIIQLVSDAAATKAPIAKIADRVSGVFVPIVMGIALVTAAVWLLAGFSMGFALARGISVLVISCPCALGLATPVAIMAGSGIGAKNGILFKTAESLEETGKIQIIAFDKTGTITAGKPSVTDLMPQKGITEEMLILTAASLEQKSEHPLASAILNYAREKEAALEEVADFMAAAGNGLSGTIQGKKAWGGNASFIGMHTPIPEDMRQKALELAEEGKTPLFFAREDQFLGVIAVADLPKEESKRAVSELRNMGIRVVMLTGDNERTARAVGNMAGIEEVIAGVLPEGKERMIRTLKKQGRTAMAGDGINDAPALKRADIGIAIGAGTDVAMDAADVVLMKSRLSDVPAAIRLSRAVFMNIRENLFWAFLYNVIGIPLAAGVWIPLFQLKLNPMFGALAMSLSSFCVVTNALRLNLLPIYDPKRDKKIKRKKKMEDVNMEKTMKIEGMMCAHCEARVQKALEGIEGVTQASVSHEAGTAVVTLSSEVSEEVLTKAVEEQDYRVLSIHS